MAETCHEPEAAAPLLRPGGLSVCILGDGSWGLFVEDPENPYLFVEECGPNQAVVLNTVANSAAARWRTVESDIGRVTLAEPTTSYFTRKK